MNYWNLQSWSLVDIPKVTVITRNAKGQTLTCMFTCKFPGSGPCACTLFELWKTDHISPHKSLQVMLHLMDFLVIFCIFKSHHNNEGEHQMQIIEKCIYSTLTGGFKCKFVTIVLVILSLMEVSRFLIVNIEPICVKNNFHDEKVMISQSFLILLFLMFLCMCLNVRKIIMKTVLSASKEMFAISLI